eukprot:TRINITY_DN3639_c2_g1_i1.p2 TRINITY_DN3639_c2_g1~~TRINITY_DN3639_c2_g1_i1.p2  ORF type:complete len:328 (+),score=134.08 TRINITY_DN3639_c2_g1_i1:194-1177(+)
MSHSPVFVLDGGMAVDSMGELMPLFEVAMDYTALCFAGVVIPTLAAALFGGKSIDEHLPGLQALGAYMGLFAAALQHHYAELLWLLNPFGFSLVTWIVLHIGNQRAKVLIDDIADAVAAWFGGNKLSHRVNTGATPEEWEWVDYMYVCVCSVLESSALYQLLNFVMQCGGTTALGDIGLLNVVPAVWVCLMVNDLLYGPMHMLLHHRWVYAYVHKQHHRIVTPGRMHTDAQNYHPVEQLLGLVCMVVALKTAMMTTGLHIIAFPIYLTCQLLMQVLNHSPYDVRFSCLGIHYESGAHEMHHRIPTCNYALYLTSIDRAAGTYRDYEG